PACTTRQARRDAPPRCCHVCPSAERPQGSLFNCTSRCGLRQQRLLERLLELLPPEQRPIAPPRREQRLVPPLFHYAPFVENDDPGGVTDRRYTVRRNECRASCERR